MTSPVTPPVTPPVRPSGGPTWGVHLTAVIALAISVGAGLFELQRARSGYALSWFYAFEWPGFGAAGAFVWITLIREGRAGPKNAARSTRPEEPDQEPDADLAAWRDYLAALRAADPPGGPPQRSEP